MTTRWMHVLTGREILWVRGRRADDSCLRCPSSLRTARKNAVIVLSHRRRRFLSFVVMALVTIACSYSLAQQMIAGATSKSASVPTAYPTYTPLPTYTSQPINFPVAQKPPTQQQRPTQQPPGSGTWDIATRAALVGKA